MRKRSSIKRLSNNNKDAQAELIIDEAIELIKEDFESSIGKNPAAVYLGRLGGLKGGKARAAKLSAEKRSEIAKLAAEARWNKSQEDED